MQKTLQQQHPDSWIPEKEGDRLEGTVVAVVRAWSDTRANGKAGDGWYPLLRIRQGGRDGKVVAFHAFTTVSYNEVVDKQPVPGEKIIVTYRGEGRAKQGQNAPRIFDVELPNRDPVAEAQATYSGFAGGRTRPAPTDAGSAPDAAGETDPLVM